MRVGHRDAVLVVVGPSDVDEADAMPAEEMQRARDAGARSLGIRDDVDELASVMDLYVLASHCEGFPRSVVDAAASGLPITATDIRDYRPVVDHGVTGLLVAALSAKALQQAVAELLTDPEQRVEMSAAAAERAVVGFDQQRQIDPTLATCDRLLRAVGRLAPARG